MAKNKYSITIFLIALAGVVIFPCLARAEVSVSLSLDRREASPADSIRVTISVTGTRNSDDPVIDGVDGFHVSTAGTSSRVQILNGRMSAAVDYTYFLQPKKPGSFQIGPARVTVDGKTYSSGTAPLRVLAQPNASPQKKGAIFLLAQISSPVAFVEEQVIYTLKLCRQARVSDLKLELPKAANLTLKKLGEPSEYQSVFDGKTYQVLELRYAVIPSREGVFEIPLARMGMVVYDPRDRTRGRSGNDPFFGDPFFDDRFFTFNRGKPTTLSSNPVELSVRPLPSQGRPSDFSGLVGQFRLSSQLEPADIQAGDSATLTVRLKGRGNVTRMPDLAIPEIVQTKVYEDQPVVEVNADENGLVGAKTMKWAIVPEDAGTYEIPTLAVSYFDPDVRQYKTIKTSPARLHVSPHARIQTTDSQARDLATTKPRAKQEIKSLGHDILPIHTSVRRLTAGSGTLPGGLMYWILFGAPPLMVGTFYFGKKLKRKAKADRAVTRAKKAAKTLVKYCRKKDLRSKDAADAIRVYLNDRFDVALGALTPQEAYKILTSRNVTGPTAQEMEKALKHLENDIYTGRGEKTCLLGEKIITTVKHIEKELR